MTAPAQVEATARQVSRDVSDGAEHKNISKALDEINAQKKSMSPAEYNDFLKGVNTKLHDGDKSNGEASFYIYDVDASGKELIVAESGKGSSLDSTMNSKDATIDLAQAFERGYTKENQWGGGKFSEEVNGGVYRPVEEGDTAWDTAKKYLTEKNKGVEPSKEDIAKQLKKIEDANPQIDDLNKIKPGQRLYIPEDEVKAIKALKGENHVKIDDEKGHLEITHPNGTATSVDYDPATKVPTKISMADKSTWTPKEGGDWQHKDAQGNVIGEGKVSRDASGNIVLEDTTGKQKATIDTRTGAIKIDKITDTSEPLKVDDAQQRKMTDEANKFAPKDGTYNPVSPPGTGDVTPGRTLDGESETGAGNTPLDYRNCETEVKENGVVEYKYEGEIEDSGWFDWGDTNFEGKETWRDGKLLKRNVKYADGIDIKFQNPNSVPAEQTISGVTEVTTELVNGKYVTNIECSDGTKYTTETTPEGKVLSFKKNG